MATLRSLTGVLIISRILAQFSWNTTTLAGNTTLAYIDEGRGSADGVGTAASFFRPTGVAIDATGAFALVVSRGVFVLQCRDERHHLLC